MGKKFKEDKFEEDLEEHLKEHIEEIKSPTDPLTDTQEADPQDEIERKRDELIKLSNDGQIDKSVSAIKKASNKTIEKICQRYEKDRMEKANVFLTDLFISKFCNLFGGFDAIEDPQILLEELKKDDLLKRDIQTVM